MFAFILILSWVGFFLIGVVVGICTRPDYRVWGCDCKEEGCLFYGTHAQAYASARRCVHAREDVKVSEVILDCDLQIDDVRNFN